MGGDLVVFGVGLALGVAVGWLWTRPERARLQGEVALERQRVVDHVRLRELLDVMKAGWASSSARPPTW